VIAKKAGQALHIPDRYHVVAKLNVALDEVRAKEVKRLKADGLGPLFLGSRRMDASGGAAHPGVSKGDHSGMSMSERICRPE